MAAVAALKLNIEIVIVFATISLCSVELHSTLFIRCKTRVYHSPLDNCFLKTKQNWYFLSQTFSATCRKCPNSKLKWNHGLNNNERQQFSCNLIHNKVLFDNIDMILQRHLAFKKEGTIDEYAAGTRAKELQSNWFWQAES